MSVVQYSSSINSSFISTVDHLPSDVVRSLWLVQSLNISIEKLQGTLEELLKQYENGSISRDELIQRYMAVKHKLEHLHDEAIQESKALYNQLVTHNLTLSEEQDQLRQIKSRVMDIELNNQFKHDLRQQLKQHYKDNPLLSQREALKEQQNMKKTKTDDLKLLLRLPKPSKFKPKAKSKPKTTIKATIKKGRPRKEVLHPPKPQPEPEPEPIFEPIPLPIEDTQVYCFCKQGSFGDMIGCDNEESCPNGEWFHYKCVGLLNRVEALKFATGKQKWYCSDECRRVVEDKAARKRKRKRKKGTYW